MLNLDKYVKEYGISIGFLIFAVAFILAGLGIFFGQQLVGLGVLFFIAGAIVMFASVIMQTL